MRPRLNLILLGVADIAKSTAFYEALGWPKARTSHAEFVKFDLGGVVLALQSRSHFAQDSNSAEVENHGFAGFALAYIAHSADEVGQVLADAERLGAQIVKPATANNWGIAGYFRDLDGHLFEVCYEDGWIFDEHDNLVV
ncbi:VOC family protein [Chitinibacter bivalviorum]|uniref:VOC family protein n=1 Tax=Chitinibacter bivalviorum TaxID=2739434 RepID=A0A7H9BI33_9NEIS|nr:VOC family protein [Chitinibacter bivalviorum]QLG87204.1 VOC family protein [Chitinibacter bivalviorum]